MKHPAVRPSFATEEQIRFAINVYGASRDHSGIHLADSSPRKHFSVPHSIDDEEPDCEKRTRYLERESAAYRRFRESIGR